MFTIALACSFTISCKRPNGLAISNFFTFIQDNPILKVISRTHQESWGLTYNKVFVTFYKHGQALSQV